MRLELIVINAENAAGGFGLTPQLAEELFDLGADVLTTGNHVWDKRELIDYMNAAPAGSQERGRRVLRRQICNRTCPAMASLRELPRTAWTTRVVQLQGCVFMNTTNDPFHAVDALLTGIQAKVIVVDFHAEATSGESRMGWHLDGRVTAVLARIRMIPPRTSECCRAGQPIRQMWA